MATNTFYLKVIAANRVFYSGRCRSIIVPEFDSQKEILAHHEDMVIAVDEGEMRFQPEGSDNWGVLADDADGSYYVDFEITTDRIYAATGDKNENGMDTCLLYTSIWIAVDLTVPVTTLTYKRIPAYWTVL